MQGEMVIAKYIRLSIEDTHSDSMSIENQRLQLDKYIADLALPSTQVMEFVDNGYSGTNFERPAVQRLLDMVREGKINCIIVKDFSRFGRNAIETGYFIERVFPLYRVRFISVCDYYEVHEGGTGGIMVALRFLVHEQYSRDLSKKIKTAKQERMRRGEHIIKNCRYGYVKVGNRLEIDPVAAKAVRLIFRLAAEGSRLTDIKKELYSRRIASPSAHKLKNPTPTELDSVWETGAIREVLRDEQYIGTYVAGKTVTNEVGSKNPKKVPPCDWIRIPNHHPAIVSVELFNRVQGHLEKKLTRKREKGAEVQTPSTCHSPLNGITYCGCCGKVMKQRGKGNFRCRFTLHAPDAPCHRFSIPADELEAAIYEVIAKQTREVLGADKPTILDAHSLRQSDLERQRESLISAKQACYEQYVLGQCSAEEYQADRDRINAELDRLARIGAQLSERQANEKTDALLQKAASTGDTLTAELVETLIEKVQVSPDGNIQISWKVTNIV